MAAERGIETRGHVVGFREEIAKAAASSDDDFFAWFNNAKDKEAAFVRGNWDFMVHIALPSSKFLTGPEDKVALEIGHGGGRLLSAACRYFKYVIGVDIHENNEKVVVELKNRGSDNFLLYKTDGREIPVERDSVDFVYSFIVLQHVEKIEIFQSYLHEANRILKPNGIAIIYFGRKYTFSLGKNSKFFYFIDRFIERLFLPIGFKEVDARVNYTNLFVSLSYAKSLARKSGFDVLSELVSHKNVPDGIKLYGGQNGLVMRKV